MKTMVGGEGELNPEMLILRMLLFFFKQTTQTKKMLNSEVNLSKLASFTAVLLLLYWWQNLLLWNAIISLKPTELMRPPQSKRNRFLNYSCDQLAAKQEKDCYFYLCDEAPVGNAVVVGTLPEVENHIKPSQTHCDWRQVCFYGLKGWL